MASIGYSYAVAMLGLKPTLIKVEAHVANGLPTFNLVGLPDSSLRESKSRVEAAISNGHISWPPCRLTVNLSPADLPKTGPSFDLAIALAMVCARFPVFQEEVRKIVFCGELGLDGSIRAVRGVLPQVLGAKQFGFDRVMVGPKAYQEAQLVKGIKVLVAKDLAHALLQIGYAQPRVLSALFKKINLCELQEKYKSARQESSEFQTELSLVNPKAQDVNLNEVRGISQAKEALKVAAAGGHNLFLVGAPGAGKTMLARCLPGILPPLSLKQSLEVAAINSLVGKPLPNSGLPTQAPFIAPHHSCSMSSMVGGGSGIALPGAISQAHNGVLFMDEAPEFNTQVLNSLRQPLEAGSISLHRAKAVTTYPASFQLILAANPCPCGLAMEHSGCECASAQKIKYLARLSGPLLDRIDIQARVYRPKLSELKEKQGPSSEIVAQEVQNARELSKCQWGEGMLNARVPTKLLRANLTGSFKDELDKLMCTRSISMRSATRISRLAFTLAHLSGSLTPKLEHLYAAYCLKIDDEK